MKVMPRLICCSFVVALSEQLEDGSILQSHFSAKDQGAVDPIPVESHIATDVFHTEVEQIIDDMVAAGTLSREGPVGPAGATGKPGKDGQDGKGPVGPAGATGPAGAPGQEGDHGKQGKDGQPGQDGKPGKDGLVPLQDLGPA